MTRRLLPVAEWARLDATEQLKDVWRLLPADRAQVLVVEDDAGQIVGTWAFLPVLHAEGVYVAPQHRQKSAVARHLLAGFQDVARMVHAPTVWTGATDPVIAGLLERHLHATRVPFESWIIPTRES